VANERIIVGIDAGTTKVTTLIAEASRNRSVDIIGFGVAPSRGLKRGVVVDMDATVDAIEVSVEKAERVSGYKVASAFVSIAGGHIASLNNRGVVAITHPDRTITEDDVARAIDAARVINVTNNREIIHTIPRQFIVDGQDGVRNPVGMVGYRVDVEAHIVTGAVTAVQNLVKCFETCDIDVDQIVLQPLAAAEAVVSDEEKDMGVALVDIGGSITEIAIFSEGSICHTAVINVGGNHITNDISVRLRAPVAEADELKINYAHALSQDIDPNETVDVATFGRGHVASIPRIQICEVAEARLQELFQLVSEEIARSGYDGLLPAGIVIVGGTAQLSGIEELGSDVTGLPVRKGMPKGVHGLVDAIGDPGYATAVGLTLWGARHGDGALSAYPSGRGEDRTSSDARRVGGRLFSWLRTILP
jgi:cell division protein FtsA